MNNEVYSTTIELYLKTHSIKETAEILNLSVVKVRRILITEGVWSSERSREVTSLVEEGLSTEEIANKLGLTIKNIQQYMPYSRGLYTEVATSDSIRSSIYRGRMKETAAAVKGEYKMGENNSLVAYLGKQKLQIGQDKQIAIGKALPKKPLQDQTLTLKLELVERSVKNDFKYNNLCAKELEKLKAFAKCKAGISRTVKVPSDITLNALHYLIQRAFGFNNTHLHAFLLDEKEFNSLVDNSFVSWGKLCGYLFRCPIEELADRYFTDDYDGSRSVRTWLKTKYQAPYINFCASDSYIKQQEYYKNLYNIILKGYADGIPVAKAAVSKMSLLDVDYKIYNKEPFNQLLERITIGELFSLNPAPKKNYLKFVKLSLDNNALRMEEVGSKDISELKDAIDRHIQEYENLNAVLSGNYDPGNLDDEPEDYISDCLFFIDRLREYIWPAINELNPEVIPQFKEIYYNYDFGNDWVIRISCMNIEDGKIKAPICISADGLNLIEDVGGIKGYIDALEVMNQPNSKEASKMKEWTRWQGFTGRQNKPVHIL